MMHRSGRFPVLLILLGLAPLSLGAQPDSSPQRYLALEDVRPGMVGVARTVFTGDKIEEFPVEIIDVLHKVGPDRDLILVRLGGDKLKATGIVRGMSGTPVYVGGKLVGALAYAWPYATEPLAGVTPIKEMLKIVEISDQEALGRALSAARDPVRSSDGFGPLAGYKTLPLLSLESPRLMPVKTPVTFGGLSQAGIEMLAARLEPYGLVASPGGTSAKVRGRKPSLLPGCPFCIQLVRGDIEVTAQGTLTDRLGTQLLGMGHQFLGEGRVSLPVASAYVHTVVPSRYMSLRISSPVESVGALVRDATSGVLAELGAEASMIDVELTVERGSEKRTYDYQVFRHPNLSAPFIAETISSSLQVWHNFPRKATVEFSAELEIEGFAPIKLEDTFSGASTFTDIVLGLSGPVGMLTDNPFAEVEVKKVKARARLTPGEQTARIESVELNRRRFRPGEEIVAQVRFAPYQAPREVRRYKIKIPEATTPGPKLLVISDARTDLQLDVRSAPYRFRPKGIQELVNVLREYRRNTELAARLTSMGYGLEVEGRELRELPPSMLNILGGARAANTSPLISFAKHTYETPWVLSGSVTLPVIVLPREEQEGAQAVKE